MAVYNLFDLLGRITELINDGCCYAEITEISSDDEFPVSLSFSSLCDYFPDEYEPVDSIPYDYENPPEPPTLSKDSPFYVLTFSETETALHALNNALEYFKECSLNKNGCYDRATLDSIKRSSFMCRNLQAKIKKFVQHN